MAVIRIGATPPGLGVRTYRQSTPIFSSTSLYIPAGCRRIEVLAIGGGGGGCSTVDGGGGGFGGLGIFEVPVTGRNLGVIIGAGGAVNTAGSPTTILLDGKEVVKIGGGGAGGPLNGAGGAGSFGGGGGGGSTGDGAIHKAGGKGGLAPFGKLLWHPNPGATRTYAQSNAVTRYVDRLPHGTTAGSGGVYLSVGQVGSFGGGCGANSVNNLLLPGALFGAGGQGISSGAPAPGGSGAGGGMTGVGASVSAGGSLAGLSIWGFTGFAGGVGAAPNSGGGGGLFGPGGNGPGGLGGGGGGAGAASVGGAGAVVFRFFF